MRVLAALSGGVDSAVAAARAGPRRARRHGSSPCPVAEPADLPVRIARLLLPRGLTGRQSRGGRARNPVLRLGLVGTVRRRCRGATSSPSTRPGAPRTRACGATRRSSSPQSWIGRSPSASTRCAPGTTRGWSTGRAGASCIGRSMPRRTSRTCLECSTPRQLAGCCSRSGSGPSRRSARERRAGAGASRRKPDSHDICFIPSGDTAGFLRERLGRPGRHRRRADRRGARSARGRLRLHDRPAARRGSGSPGGGRGAAVRRGCGHQHAARRRRARGPAGRRAAAVRSRSVERAHAGRPEARRRAGSAHGEEVPAPSSQSDGGFHARPRSSRCGASLPASPPCCTTGRGWSGRARSRARGHPSRDRSDRRPGPDRPSSQGRESRAAPRAGDRHRRSSTGHRDRRGRLRHQLRSDQRRHRFLGVADAGLELADVHRGLPVRLRGRHGGGRGRCGGGLHRDAAREPQRALRDAPGASAVAPRPAWGAPEGGASARGPRTSRSTSRRRWRWPTSPTPSRCRRAFWATGWSVFLLWNLGTLLGALGAAAVQDPRRLGLDAAIPAGFLALLWPRLVDRSAWALAVVSGVLALALSPVLRPGLPVLTAAGIAVAGALWLTRGSPGERSRNATAHARGPRPEAPAGPERA